MDAWINGGCVRHGGRGAEPDWPPRFVRLEGHSRSKNALTISARYTRCGQKYDRRCFFPCWNFISGATVFRPKQYKYCVMDVGELLRY
jgi:hypothetical protein